MTTLLRIFMSALCLLLMTSSYGQSNIEKKFTSERDTQVKEVKPLKPSLVYFGIYPINLYDLNMTNHLFKISFYAWWRTQNKDYHPEKSVEIINATDYYYKFGKSGKNGNEYFTFVHFYATIHKQWSTKSFPFDRQLLEIKLEDFSDVNKIIFQPDYEHSHIHPELILEGWRIEKLSINNSVTEYKTNFGDISTPKGFYSRLTFEIEIKREGWRPFFYYFIGFFIAAFLTIMGTFVKFEFRLALVMSAVFSYIGNLYILTQVLPYTSEFTLADAIQTATFFLLVASVLIYILIHNIFRADRIKEKKTIFYVEIVISSVYLIYIISKTWAAVIS